MNDKLRRLIGMMVKPLAGSRRAVVRMDGGICSQMNFYLMGEEYRRRGLDVSFDVSWFTSCGTDMDGRFARNLDLLRLFPSLPWRECRGSELWMMRKVYPRFGDYFHGPTSDWPDFTPPLYLCGYYENPAGMYARLFRSTFQVDARAVLDAENLQVLERVEAAGADAVAMHVRRGDLSGYNPAYGHPATPAYFGRALQAVAAQCQGRPQVFVFSDEPQWVRAELLPSLAHVAADFHMVDINGSDRGYMDLALMSCCHHVVCSQGSHGKFAAMLRPERWLDGLVTVPDEPASTKWTPNFSRWQAIGL